MKRFARTLYSGAFFFALLLTPALQAETGAEADCAQGRVGHHPGRFEAEDMQLTGYTLLNVIPWENASAGTAIRCASSQSCGAAFRPNLAAGRYEIATQYFDLNIGKAKFRLYIRNRSGDRLLDEWTADDDLPSARIGGDTSTRYRTFAISLAPQDEIRVEGLPDRGDPAARLRQNHRNSLIRRTELTRAIA